MKTLFCLLALALTAVCAAPSGIYGYGYAAAVPAYGAYAGAGHYGYAAPRPLVTYPNGAVVPADEPAVVAARADHLAAKGAIVHARYGAYGAYGYGH